MVFQAESSKSSACTLCVKEIYPTISYQVQKLFGNNAGDAWPPTKIEDLGQGERFAASAVQDEETGDVIVKLVNGDGETRVVSLHLDGATGPRPRRPM